MTTPVTNPTATAAGLEPALEPETQALKDALGGIVGTLARLAVARGLPFATVEEMLKIAFVQAASAAHPGWLAHRKVSRISAATGIHRREVTRLSQPQPDTAARGGLLASAARGGSPTTAARSRSLASEVFAHWRTQAPYRSRNGSPKTLPRQGPAPSFETLAQAVTRNVHPRSLLDELCRLGLAVLDEASDTVALAREAFVPRGDRVRLLGFLGDNVGDHLHAAVDNVLGDDRLHFEQAVFADGLSAQSMAAVRPAVGAQWQALLAALVPQLESCVESDAVRTPAPQGRMRIGLYTYQEDPAAAAPALPPVSARRVKRAPRPVASRQAPQGG